MKTKKRILSLILAVVMLSCFCVAFAAEKQINESISVELSVMTDMKIMDTYPDGSIDAGKAVTRAEMTVMLMKLLGYGNIAGAGDAFNDVSPEYWAYGSILLAKNLDIINGDGANCFNPDKEATVLQAIKMVLCGLGYKVLAENKGGWPSGYLSVADINKLLKDVSGDYNRVLTKADAAKLLYNALSVELFTESVNGEFKKGDTLFETYYEMYDWMHLEGVVTANYDTSVMETAKLKENEVIINGVKYDSAKTDADSMLGMSVEFYSFIDQNGKNVILSIFPTKDNTAITVGAGKISALSSKEMSYYEDEEETEEMEISFDNPKLIINRQWINGYKETDFEVTEGNVTAIDNDGDENFDYIFIIKSESFMVDRVTEDGKLVYLKQAEMDGRKAISLDEGSDVHYEILKNGSKINATEIKSGDIIKISVSPNLKRVFVEVSNKFVDGYLTEILDEGEKIGVDGVYYEVSGSYAGKIDTLKFGNQYRFYIDSDERIAFSEKGSLATESDMAYMMGVEKAKGLRGSVQIKALIGGKTYEVEDESADEDEQKTITEAQNAAIKIMQTEKEIKIDGEKYKALDAMAMLSALTVFRYKLNADGLLSSIETTQSFALKEARYFNKNIKSFGKTTNQAFLIDDETDVFLFAGSDTDDDYFVKVQIKDGEEYVVEGVGRRDDDGYVVDALVLYDSTMVSVVGEIKPETKDSLVKEVTRKIDDDNNEYVQLVMLTDGEEETRLVKETNKTSNVIEKIRQGSVIRYSEDSYGKIDNIELVSNLDSMSKNIHSGAHSAKEIIFAKCTSLQTDILSNIRNEFVDKIGLSITGNAENEQVFNAVKRRGPKYYIFDKAAKTVINAVPDEINTVENCGLDGADMVFAHLISDDVRIVVIVR